MGIFSRIFRGSSNDDKGANDSVSHDEIEECQLCGTKDVSGDDMLNVDIEFPQGHISVVCESCFDEHDMGSGMTAYCCGMIYEEGESVCASCGEPL